MDDSDKDITTQIDDDILDMVVLPLPPYPFEVE